MPIPVVKEELIVGMGHNSHDLEYLVKIEQDFFKENRCLAIATNLIISALDSFIDDEEQLRSAQIITKTVSLMVYQANKQQMICDELSWN